MGMECFELKWGRMLDVAVVPIIMHDFALSDSNTTLLYATPFIMEQTTPQSHKYFAYQDPAEEAQQVRISYHVALVIPHGLCELVQPYGGICKKVGGGGFQKHEGTREGSEAGVSPGRTQRTYGQPLVCNGLNINTPAHGLQQLPQALNSHTCAVLDGLLLLGA
eukprot:scaffold240010_cov17-Tisochrysis_lutea.AAC.1